MSIGNKKNKEEVPENLRTKAVKNARKQSEVMILILTFLCLFYKECL